MTEGKIKSVKSASAENIRTTKRSAKNVATKNDSSKKTAINKSPSTKIQATKMSKKTKDRIILEIDGNQIELSEIEKKAAALGGDVYIVAGEKKLYDANGNSVSIF